MKLSLLPQRLQYVCDTLTVDADAFQHRLEELLTTQDITIVEAYKQLLRPGYWSLDDQGVHARDISSEPPPPLH